MGLFFVHLSISASLTQLDTPRLHDATHYCHSLVPGYCHQGVQEVSKVTRPDLDCNRGNIAYFIYLFLLFLHLFLYIIALSHTSYKLKTLKISYHKGDTVKKTELFKIMDSRDLKSLRLVY